MSPYPIFGIKLTIRMTVAFIFEYVSRKKKPYIGISIWLKSTCALCYLSIDLFMHFYFFLHNIYMYIFLSQWNWKLSKLWLGLASREYDSDFFVCPIAIYNFIVWCCIAETPPSWIGRHLPKDTDVLVLANVFVSVACVCPVRSDGSTAPQFES